MKRLIDEVRRSNGNLREELVRIEKIRKEFEVMLIENKVFNSF